jgi:homeobox protein DLX2
LTLQVKIWFQNRRSKYKKMMKAAQQQVGGGGGGSNGSLSHATPTTPSQMSPSDSEGSPSPDGSQHGGYLPHMGMTSSGPGPAAGTPVSDMSPPPPTLSGSPPLASSAWDIKPLPMGGDPSLQMGPGAYLPQYSWYQTAAASMNQGLLT